MKQLKSMQRTCALSIDMEDWFHQELMKGADITNKVSSLAETTNLILDLLKKHKAKATFFVLGELICQNQALLKRIFEQGHEIACHGFTHHSLYEIQAEGLKSELSLFKQSISAILGDVVIRGFRAPNFSLNQDTAWAIDVLKDHNFKYDSSIFPLNIGFYGVNKAPIGPYGISSNSIKTPDTKSTLIEFPITVFAHFGFRVPFVGGFYTRAIPFALQRSLLKKVLRERNAIIYVHSWEFSLWIPRVRLSIWRKFFSYYNIGTTAKKIEWLLGEFEFDRIDKTLGLQ